MRAAIAVAAVALLAACAVWAVAREMQGFQDPFGWEVPDDEAR